MQANKYEMINNQWLQICDLFSHKFTRGRKPKNYRDIFNALLWLARTVSH